MIDLINQLLYILISQSSQMPTRSPKKSLINLSKCLTIASSKKQLTRDGAIRKEEI